MTAQYYNCWMRLLQLSYTKLCIIINGKPPTYCLLCFNVCITTHIWTKTNFNRKIITYINDVPFAFITKSINITMILWKVLQLLAENLETLTYEKLAIRLHNKWYIVTHYDVGCVTNIQKLKKKTNTIT